MEPNTAMDIPPDFRCPISMELMEDPVTISTGVTYERKNIQKWLFNYKRKTCPATMQGVDNYDITPNHTLKRLILAWQNEDSNPHSSPPPSSPPPSPPPQSPRPLSAKHDQLISILETIESTPFKVSSLKKLHSIVATSYEVKLDFLGSGGVEALVRIIVQILVDFLDFATFRACEEALSVLSQLPLSEKDETFRLLSKPESMKSMAIMLQKGSTEARSNAISIYRKIANADYDWNSFIQDQGNMDFFKSLLELVSDEMCSKASTCALEVLIEILSASKKSRLEAIEAGAICTLIELLPDSNANRSKCEKMLMLIKLLCECAEGRLAMVEHGLGIAAVTKKMLHFSDTATKIGVKILWLISSFHPSERVLEEMLMTGSVKKLLVLLHIGGRSSTKDKVVNMFKLHGNSWRRYPCFPYELKDYLGLVNDS